MDVSGMDGMEEVRSSILLSSTPKPQVDGLGFLRFSNRIRQWGLIRDLCELWRAVRSRFMMDTVAPVGGRQFQDWFR